MRSFAFLCLAIVALWGCGNPPSSTTTSESGSQVDSHEGHDHATADGPSLSPENNPEIKKIIEKSGAVIYPGASIPDGKSNISKMQHGTRYELVMYSKDSAEKVAQWYRDQLHLNMENGRMSITLVGMVKDNSIPVIIAVYEEEGRTRISFAGRENDPDAPKGPGG